MLHYPQYSVIFHPMTNYTFKAPSDLNTQFVNMFDLTNGSVVSRKKKASVIKLQSKLSNITHILPVVL